MDAHSFPGNDSLPNRAAWNWLKKAKASIDPRSPQLLTLALWGMENRVEGDWPLAERDALEMQMGYLR